MKNLLFYIKFAIVVVIIGWIAKAHALKPSPVPKALQDEAANSVQIHKGMCKTPSGKQELCMVGYDQATDTFWMLLFNEEGVLYQVVEIKGEKHRVRWTHPGLVV